MMGQVIRFRSKRWQHSHLHDAVMFAFGVLAGVAYMMAKL